MKHGYRSSALMLTFGIATLGLASTARSSAQAGAAPAAAPPAAHVVLTPADLKWGPAPPVLPAGAQVAVLDGDPFKPGFFAIRLKMPDGYRIAPHWHPTDEHIVVIQGTFRIGMGDKYREASAHALAAGGFAKLPKKMHHYAGAKGETIVQVYGDGPFQITYVDPADDPSRAGTR